MTNFYFHLDVRAITNFSVFDTLEVKALIRIQLCTAMTVKSKHTKWVVCMRTTNKTDKINKASVSASESLI